MVMDFAENYTCTMQNEVITHNSTGSLYVFCVIISSVFRASCSMYILLLLFFISNKVQISIKAIFNMTNKNTQYVICCQ